MRIFHIALVSDWQVAVTSGGYTTSTRGQTLAEVGFIHASHAEQVEPTRARFYADETEPLVLLTIDTDLLTCPWHEDQVGEETFPHLYGPLTTDAVVEIEPL
jgi:uncharacterized protein (DUF952 family)